MSTINPNAIDDTKPVQGDPTTASVRANETATKTQLQNAKNDIEALEPHPPRTDNPHNVTAAQAGAAPLVHTHVLADITDSGTAASRDVGALAANVPDITIADGRYEAAGAVAAHEAAGDPHSQYLTPAEGDAVYAPLSHVGATGAAHGDFSSVVAGFTPASGGGTTNFLRADGAWAAPPGGGGGEANTSSNLGAGAQLAAAKSGVDLPFRTLISGDSSVTFTQSANTIDIRATGAGGGEANDGANLGAGEGVFAQKNGVSLEFKSLVGGDGVTLSSTATEITAAVDVTVARLGAANTFTATPQRIHTASGGAQLELRDDTPPANQRMFHAQSASSFFTVDSLTDAGAKVGESMFSIGHRNSIAGQGVTIGSPTGGFPGSDSLNVGGVVQVNGVALVTQAQTDALYAPISHTHTLADITDSGTAAAADTGTGPADVPTTAQADARYTPITLTANGELLTFAAGQHAKIGIGTAGQVLTVVGGIPQWAAVPGGASTYTETHSWAIAGDVGNDTYPGFYVVGTEAANCVKVRHRVSSGSCTGQLQRNGSNIGGAMTIGTGDTETAISVSLAEDDRIELVISGGSTPQNLMATVHVERTFP